MPFKHQTLHPWVAWRLVVEAGGAQWRWRLVVVSLGVAVRAFQTSDTASMGGVAAGGRGWWWSVAVAVRAFQTVLGQYPTGQNISSHAFRPAKPLYSRHRPLIQIHKSWVFVPLGYCPLGYCPPWVDFVSLGYCPPGLLSPLDFVPLGFCPPWILSAWILSYGVLSSGILS